MNGENFYYSAYNGSKDFSQQNVRTANATGFGAAADDYAERGIDLNEQLIKNKPATFFLRVNSDAMSGAGIHIGDVVIVDRSLEPKNGKIVIAVVDGELLIRKLEVTEGKKLLHAANKKLHSIDVTDKLKLWGVVTYIIHNV
ncbi:LexA family protein [Flavisolibacter ginsenosidimutans]|uniref:Translesion error-prone DNA polymerase V autoproteolytic subunit n=1 Tax=Flavisolibacter ginsenosidimutans TaxID=661481 RepID=A0A5B8UNN2_9BACT|nr:translesion error-prone DNA polymerase V autoproteolytic subunit [Flavisolibacter ginsenosidimutans]QEC57829.1 translesion error-prone DNA polymerase V autoproteolytic subunit [Flavisolibacter ginsenosidimutans]